MFLGSLDTVVGLLILYSDTPLFSAIAGYMAIFSLAKGIWSVVCYVCSFSGMADIAAGVVLFLMISGANLSLLGIFGIIMILKGFYSIVSSIF